jgi:acetyl esterase/lipase
MSEPPPPTNAAPASASPAAAQAPAALLTWPEFLGRTRPAPDHVIRYGDHERQVVDLYLPTGGGPHPVVVMIHGGCWSAPWDRTLMNHASDDLRKRGIAVWNIDYRVIGEGGGYPGTFADTAAATDALRQHAASFRLSLRPLVAVGHSAGGHLALWLAARRAVKERPENLLIPSRSPIRGADPLPLTGVVSLGGLPDLELAATPPGSGCGTEVIEKLVGPPTMSSRNVYADTSIPRLAPLGIPQVLINGLSDRIIPNHFAEDYAQKMRVQGDDVRVRMIPNTGHIELIAPESAAWAAAVQEIERALGIRNLR